MKKTFLLLFLICIFGCDKDDKPSNPIDQLPPATQTGAGTFGCLVNGKPYVDKRALKNIAYFDYHRFLDNKKTLVTGFI